MSIEAQNIGELQLLFEQLNPVLERNGFLKMKVVDPGVCKAQKVNARYVSVEKMRQLIDNVKNEGALESVPLCYEENGAIKIISGHHRVEAAKEAGLDKIIVMIANISDRDDIVSKQLSHNALAGEDDKTILKELFDSIQSVAAKMATGLSSELEPIQLGSLSFKLGGDFKTLTLTFIPDEMNVLDETLETIIKEDLKINSKDDVIMARLPHWPKFAKALREVKGIENIKSNGIALLRLAELAQERLVQIKLEDCEDGGEI